MKTNLTVENILRDNVYARSSDKELFIDFMQRMGMRLSDNQIATFRKMPSLESVRRIRQKLQEQGKYPPTQQVGLHRRIKSYVMQQNMPQSSVEYTGKLFDDTSYNLDRRGNGFRG